MNRNKCCAIENLTKVIEKGFDKLGPGGNGGNNCCDSKADKNADNISEEDKVKWKEKLGITDTNSGGGSLIALEHDDTNFILDKDYLLVLEESNSFETNITDDIDEETGRKIIRLNFDEKDDLQKVTSRGNTTTFPINVQNIWIKNDFKNNLFETKDFELLEKQSLNDNIIKGENILSKIPNKVLKHQFEQNLIIGKEILTELVGEGTKSYFDDRAVYNDCNVIVGIDLANTKQFKTAENNIIFGSDIFHNDFGTEEGNDFHAFSNTVVGFNIQSHQNLYNIHQNKPEFTKTNIALNTIVGQNFHANVYEKSTILGHIQYGNQYKRSIIIGYSSGVGAHKHDFSGPQHNYEKNIIISNGFNPNVYKDASKVSDYMYIGNETPLMEGILDTTNKRLKTYGRFQIDGNDPKNNVQGDLTYTKKVVAKPDGTFGLVNDNTKDFDRYRIQKIQGLDVEQFLNSKQRRDSVIGLPNRESFELNINETGQINNAEISIKIFQLNNRIFKFVPSLYYIKDNKLVLYFSDEMTESITSLLETNSETSLKPELTLTYFK